MSIQCDVRIVDWAAFVSTFKTKPSDCDSLDLWFEFIETPEALESGSLLHGPCYDNYKYFGCLHEAYGALRWDLPETQSNDWELFFGILIPSYFDQVRGFTPADVPDAFDFEQFHVPEMLQVALDPKSVGKLYSEVWCQLDLAEFEKCADSASELIRKVTCFP